MKSKDMKTVNPWDVLKDFWGYIRTDRKEITLKEYNSIYKKYRSSIINAIFHSGAGYLTVAIGLLSGLCELAKAFAIPLAPKLFHGLQRNSGWLAYIKTGPLEMAALGISIIAISVIFRNLGIEKYKARRGLPAKFPNYNCSPVNVAISIIFTVILMSVCTHLILFDIERFWFICLTAIAMCTVRTASILPTDIGIKGASNKLALVFRILVSLTFAVVLGALLFYLPFDPWSFDSNLSMLMLILQWFFLLVWQALIGSGEIAIWITKGRKETEKQQTIQNDLEDFRAPEAWLVRSLGYKAMLLCLSFCFLILAITAAAPFFVLTEMIPPL